MQNLFKKIAEYGLKINRDLLHIALNNKSVMASQPNKKEGIDKEKGGKGMKITEKDLNLANRKVLNKAHQDRADLEAEKTSREFEKKQYIANFVSKK